MYLTNTPVNHTTHCIILWLTLNKEVGMLLIKHVVILNRQWEYGPWKVCH